ncbi:MAG: prepilin peptidase [Clostridia bacterium]|nr:prepilin peptidase [Clostridia bacterium]
MSIVLTLKIFFVVMTTLFGIIIGSFLNVVIYRIPEGRTISKGHSMCMSCGHTLGALDLVPVFSWLFLGGKCRYCRAPVASRYIKIESFTGLVFLIVGFTFRAAGLYPLLNEPGNRVILFVIACMALFLLNFTIMISQMMIYYDKQKCFFRFPVLSLITVLAFSLLSAFTYKNYYRILSNLAIFLVVSILLSLLITGISKLREIDYKFSDSLFDFSNLLLIFAVAIRYISAFNLIFSIIIFGSALIYVLIRLFSIKNSKLCRYIGIINMCMVVILLILGYIIFLNK